MHPLFRTGTPIAAIFNIHLWCISVPPPPSPLPRESGNYLKSQLSQIILVHIILCVPQNCPDTSLPCSLFYASHSASRESLPARWCCLVFFLLLFFFSVGTASFCFAPQPCAGITYRPWLLWCRYNVAQNLTPCRTVHAWRNMSPYCMLLRVSLPDPGCTQKWFVMTPKKHITGPNPWRTYFLDFILPGTANIRCKKWKKPYFAGTYLPRKKCTSSTGVLKGTTYFNHNFWGIVSTANVTMKFHCTMLYLKQST